jgi:hypothetical protein
MSTQNPIEKQLRWELTQAVKRIEQLELRLQYKERSTERLLAHAAGPEIIYKLKPGDGK